MTSPNHEGYRGLSSILQKKFNKKQNERKADTQSFTGTKSVNMMALQLLNITKDKKLPVDNPADNFVSYLKNKLNWKHKNLSEVNKTIVSAMKRLEKKWLVKIKNNFYVLNLEKITQNNKKEADTENEQKLSPSMWNDKIMYQNHKQIAKAKIKEITKLLKKNPDNNDIKKRLKSAHRQLKKANKLLDCDES